MQNNEIYIVDDDPAIIDSLSLLLEALDFQITSFKNGQEFLEFDLRDFQGCVLLDVRMPGKDGMTVLQETLTKYPNTAIIMISGHGDIPMAIKAMELGAVDFIEKPFRSSKLRQAIKKADSLVQAEKRRDVFSKEAQQKIALLTPRELEVGEKLADGKPNKIVAFELGISIRTIEAHRAKILSKLQVRSLADLVKLFLANSNLENVVERDQ
ncbi:MAG: response regulator transcription factor [Hellea sp.]|nr:response regulator transcription factor [Hellea sp.]